MTQNKISFSLDLNFWSRPVNNRPELDWYTYQPHDALIGPIPAWFWHITVCSLGVEYCTFNTVHLTHWGRDKMDAISQTTSSSAFSWMKMFEFRLKFQWNLFLGVQLTIFQHWFRWWLGSVQATNHYLNQRWLVSLTTHICVTRPQRVNSLWPSDAIWHHEISVINIGSGNRLVLEDINSLRPSDAKMRQQSKSSLVQIMACRLIGAKPLSEPVLEYC